MLINKSPRTLKAVIVSSFFQIHLAQDTYVGILRMYRAIFLSTLRIFGSWYLITKLSLGKSLLLVQLFSPCDRFPLWLLVRFFFVSSDLRTDSDSHSCDHNLHSYTGWNCFPRPHHWTHLSYKLQELWLSHSMFYFFLFMTPARCLLHRLILLSLSFKFSLDDILKSLYSVWRVAQKLKFAGSKL